MPTDTVYVRVFFILVIGWLLLDHFRRLTAIVIIYHSTRLMRKFTLYVCYLIYEQKYIVEIII